MVSIEALYDPNSEMRDFHTIYEALYVEQRLLNLRIEVIDDNSTYLKLKHVIFFFPCPNLIYTDINNLLGSSTPLSCAKPATSACV